MRALIWVMGIWALIFLSLFLLKDEIRRQLLPNVIAVQTKGKASIHEIRIDWTHEGAQDTLMIYRAGEDTGVNFEAAGWNTFLLYYENKRVGQFDQFKTSATLPHTYLFEIDITKNDSIYTNLKIVGENAN